jgi:hypothetical protein
MAIGQLLRVAADPAGRAWLDSHPSSGPLVIAFDVKRCCGGAKLCTVSIRAWRQRDRGGDYVHGLLEGGPALLIDRRAAARLPARFGLTVRGRGPLKHLDLVLDSEEWGSLLYE